MNRSRLPVWLHSLLPSKDDPRNLFTPDLFRDSFEDLISSIKIDSTWKSTCRRRHPITDQLIVELVSTFSKTRILDVGASSGSTSLELLDRLGGDCAVFHVTDLFFSIPFVTRGRATYFYHPHAGECVMRVTNWFLMYKEVEGAFFPLGALAKRLIARAPRIDRTHEMTVSLLQPDLKRRIAADPRIIVHEYNVLELWPYEPVDIVKVANVLNRSYFPDCEIVKAITNLKHALKPEGKLVITDNRGTERVSMFAKRGNGTFVLEKEIGGGADVRDLIS